MWALIECKEYTDYWTGLLNDYLRKRQKMKRSFIQNPCLGCPRSVLVYFSGVLGFINFLWFHILSVQSLQMENKYCLFFLTSTARLFELHTIVF